MQKFDLDFELDSSDENNKETDFSELPDLISVSDDGFGGDSDDIRSHSFQIFSRLSVFNSGLQKVTEDINSLKKDAADITLLMKNLYLLLSKRTSCGENIVLNMEENSDEGELCGEHFSSPLYTKIPSQVKRFCLDETNDEEDEEEEDEEEEDHDDVSEEEEDNDENVSFSEDEDEDPNGLGKSTIFD